MSLAGCVLWIIGRYRASGGGRRWFGIDCNFEPSCSAYTEEAIRRHGLIPGLRLGRDRIRRCNRRDAVCKCIEPVPDLATPSHSHLKRRERAR